MRTAFRKLCLVCHPDKTSSSSAKEAFNKLSIAYSLASLASDRVPVPLFPADAPPVSAAKECKTPTGRAAPKSTGRAAPKSTGRAAPKAPKSPTGRAAPKTPKTPTGGATPKAPKTPTGGATPKAPKTPTGDTVVSDRRHRGVATEEAEECADELPH